jgi:hypothetical protein
VLLIQLKEQQHQHLSTASNTLSASITPSATANKIFIIATFTVYDNENDAFFTVYRGASDLGAASNKGFAVNYGGGVGSTSTSSIAYSDSPSTTSSTTYQIYFRHASGVGTAYLNYSNTKSSITLMEIKG